MVPWHVLIPWLRITTLKAMSNLQISLVYAGPNHFTPRSALKL